jgi:hypothetical protein
MLATKDQLVRQWIAYLKNNQIVELSPSANGKLTYIKQPTQEDLRLFLQRFFSDEDIEKALSNAKRSQTLRSKKSVPESLKDTNPCWKGYHPVGTKIKDGKTVPNCVPTAEENIEEDFTDQQLPVDEKFVNSVFQSIIRIQNFNEKQKEAEIQEKKKNLALERLREIISGMTVTQRSQLLAALKNSKIAEYVSETSGTKLDIQSLIRQWKNSNYPKSVNSLKFFLLKTGYSLKDIKNVIYSYFGKQPPEELPDPDNSPAIQRIVKISQDLGIIDQLIEILEKEYKVTEQVLEYADIKSLLETMSGKNLERNIRFAEKKSLGKNKKH